MCNDAQIERGYPSMLLGRSIDDLYVFLPLDQVTEPPEGLIMHYKNHWWSVHPERGLAFYNPRDAHGKRRSNSAGAAQANSSESLSRRVAAQHHPFPHTILQIPSVFVPVDLRDYL